MSGKTLSERLLSAENEEDIQLAEVDVDREWNLIKLNLRKEELKSNKQDRRARKDFADKIFWLLIIFLAIILIIVSLSAIEPLCFKLSDTVLITLLATASANVISIFIIVVKYLFKPTICPSCGYDHKFKMKKEED